MGAAAGSAAIAARGISVGKEIVMASALGLVTGSVFKVCGAWGAAAGRARPRRSRVRCPPGPRPA